MRADTETIPEIVGERPDVETGGAVDPERDTVALDGHDVYRVGCHADRGGKCGRGRKHRSTTRSARQTVAAAPFDLLRRKRRRLLQKRSAKRVEGAIDRVARRPWP